MDERTDGLWQRMQRSPDDGASFSATARQARYSGSRALCPIIMPLKACPGSAAGSYPPWQLRHAFGASKLPPPNGCVPGISKSRSVVGATPPGVRVMVNRALLWSRPELLIASRATTRTRAPARTGWT